MVLLALASQDSRGYVGNREDVNGYPERWDTTNTGLASIDALGRVLVKANQAGCAEHSSFTGPIDEFQAVRDCLQVFNDLEYCDITLKYSGISSNTGDSSDGTNVVFFDNSTISDGVFGVTTVTYDPSSGEILDADIALNDKNYVWDTLGRGTSGQSNKVYIEEILIHEMGHFLGLDHTFLKAATMASGTFVGSISKTSLHQDDISGISNLYPTTEFTQDHGAIGGFVTLSGLPAMGACFAAIDVETLRPVLCGLSELNGALAGYAFAGLPPGKYYLITYPIDNSVLGDYFANAVTIFEPQIAGLDVGEESDASAPRLAEEVTVAAQGYSLRNFDLTPITTNRPFETNNLYTQATQLNVTGSEPVVLVAAIETAYEPDWFKFNVTMGKKYTFAVLSDCFKSGFDPKITLYDFTGSTELISPEAGSSVYDTNADDSDFSAYDADGEDLDPRITGWIAPSTQTVYLKVSGYLSSVGWYMLYVRAEEESDVPCRAASKLNIDKTALPANSGQTAIVEVLARNKFGEPITTLASNAVTITVGTTPYTASQDGSDLSRYTLSLVAGAVAGSEDIIALISPLTELLLDTKTVYYTTALDYNRCVASVSPDGCYANGYSQIKVTLKLLDSANRPVYDSTRTVNVTSSAGSLGTVGFDVDTGYYTCLVTAPESDTDVAATIEVRLDSNLIGTFNITFDGKVVPVRSSSSSSSGGGCSMASGNRGDWLVPLFVLLLVLVVMSASRRRF